MFRDLTKTTGALALVLMLTLTGCEALQSLTGGGDDPPVSTDVPDAQADLKILYAPGDWSGAVTQDVTLETSVGNNVDVSWKSDQPSVISTTGFVTRPAEGEANVSVTLTATLSKDGESKTKRFTVTVLALTGGSTDGPVLFLRGQMNNWQTTPLAVTGDGTLHQYYLASADGPIEFKFGSQDWYTSYGQIDGNLSDIKNGTLLSTYDTTKGGVPATSISAPGQQIDGNIILTATAGHTYDLVLNPGLRTFWVIDVPTLYLRGTMNNWDISSLLTWTPDGLVTQSFQATATLTEFKFGAADWGTAYGMNELFYNDQAAGALPGTLISPVGDYGNIGLTTVVGKVYSVFFDRGNGLFWVVAN